MMTMRLFTRKFDSIPVATSWYLSDIGEARGKQELFTRQSPQRLKVLREHALIESAVSSNRIEGVEIDQSRIGTILFGKPPLKDRDEEEVRGYRKALADAANGTFSVSELQDRCPNVSIDMIRRILKKLRADKQIECLGRGQSARWQKTDEWQLGNVDSIR